MLGTVLGMRVATATSLRQTGSFSHMAPTPLSRERITWVCKFWASEKEASRDLLENVSIKENGKGAGRGWESMVESSDHNRFLTVKERRK